MFSQLLVPTHSLWTTVLLALVPLVVLLFLLAVLRMTAWLATLIACVITAAIAAWAWRALLLPSLNSVGAEVGKPIAPQTASFGISTSKLVRDEGQVIRHNMAWTVVVLAYLIVIGFFYFRVAYQVMQA